MEECEEPMCNEPATHDWNGRKVCKGHYHMYVDREYKLIEGKINDND